MSGKELIEYLEEHEINKGAVIEVYKHDGFMTWKEFEMNYDGRNLEWESGTFKAYMLWADNYTFRINIKRSITKWEDIAIKDMKNGKTLGHLKPYIETIMRTQNEIIDKLEELDER